ncbi:MAG: GtrA family protein [Candidatus Kerfeldbacteria bacterium]|nr:GtrA family protein [Candidatus Kerfeldbacteria bacterium]
MIPTVRELLVRYRQFLLYSLIGVSGVGLDFVVYSMLVYFDVLPYQIANVISYSLGTTNNFFWNAYANFKITDQMLRRFVSFFAIGCVGLLVSSGLLYLFIQILEENKFLSKAGTIIVIVLLQYFLNKHISFKKAHTWQTPSDNI